MKYVAVLAFVENESCVAMVQKRSKKLPHLDGKWNGIGGKMEIGESPIGAAIREFGEETGILLTQEDLVFVEHQRFINGVTNGEGRYCQGDEIYWYATRGPAGLMAGMTEVNDVGEELAWAPITHYQADLGWTIGGLCPNLVYLIPKAITMLRTPYLDRPA